MQRAQQQVQSASKTMAQALGAMGVGLGAAQFVRFAVDADKVATSFRRQSVAARELAGSQGQLNELLRAYEQATGGAVDKATALGDVTRLLAVGFADSAEELKRFVTAARGISVATGQQQDYVISQLQLAIANQSTLRLDQLGLGVSEVKQRIDELREANKNLTREMAFQQAVLDLANEKFGGIAQSADAGATGLENLTKAWKDFQLAFGQGAGDGSNVVFNQWASDIERATSELQTLARWMNEVEQAGARFRASMGFNLPAGSFNNLNLESGGSIGGRGATGAGTRSRFTDDQTAVITEWHRATLEIERNAARDRLDATRQFEQQRSDTIRQYEQSIAREAQDFARQRARAEEDYALGLQRTHRDIAQREARQLEDLERTIADARLDAVERMADRQVALDERIAETRTASNERIAELEADFAKRRERAGRDHAERLQDAAAQLDAVAVYRQQREFAKRKREDQEDFNERLAKERKNEEKRLDELEKAHAKQTASEAKALQKRIDDANRAYQRQLEDARAADEQRRTDQAADFALRQERENEDRAIRLARMAEDFQDQLAEQARQHELRLLQIAEQEQEERAKLDEEFQKELAALGIRTQKYKDQLKAYEDAAIAAFDAVWGHMLGRMQGPLVSPWAGPVFSGPGGNTPIINSGSIAPSGSRAVTFAQGAIVINGDGMNERQVAQYVYDLIMSMTRGLPR